MSSDPKNYFVFLVDEISEPGLTTKWLFLDTLEQFSANWIVNIHITNYDWKPHLNLLNVFDESLEMSSDPKNSFGFT